MDIIKVFAAYLMIALICNHGVVDAYGTGAPPFQCGPMSPSGHGAIPQASLAPYTVTTDSQYYTTGQMRTSKLSSKIFFCIDTHTGM